MPDLDQLLAPSSTPGAFGGAQVYEGRVSKVNDRGVYVTIPAFDPRKLWGPCLPVGLSAGVDERVAVAMSDQGRPWVLSVGGSAGGGNIDGGHPGSEFGGTPLIDGGGVTR